MKLKSLTEMSSAFGFLKRISIISVVGSICISVAAIAYAAYENREAAKRLYLVESNGEAFSAKLTAKEDRRPEIISQARNFHKLFYEIDQFNYETQVNDALYLIGNSGKDLYLTLKASGWYSKLVSNNLKQTIQEDSLKVDASVYPYAVKYYGRIMVSRTDLQVVSKKYIQASFIMYNVARTEKNPHGLLIENYLVRNYE